MPCHLFEIKKKGKLFDKYLRFCLHFCRKMAIMYCERTWENLQYLLGKIMKVEECYGNIFQHIFTEKYVKSTGMQKVKRNIGH